MTDDMVQAAQNAVRRVRYGLTDTEMRAALTAALAVQTQQGVEVPHDPTDAMIDAAMNVNWECDGDERATAINVWHAMYAAALVDVPAVESEAVAWTSPGQLREIQRGTNGLVTKYGDEFMSVPLYAHPPRSLTNEGSETIYRWRGPRGGWIYDEEPPKWDHEILTLSTRKGSAGDGAATSANGGDHDR